VIGRPEHQSAFKVLERVVESDDPNTVKLWNASSVITKEKLDDALKAKQTPLKLPMHLLPLSISSQRRLGTWLQTPPPVHPFPAFVGVIGCHD